MRRTEKTGLFLAAIIFILGVSNIQAQEIIESYDVPANSSGLAFDGTLLWMGGIGEAGNWIRAVNPETGALVDSIPAPVPNCLGLAWYKGNLAYLSSHTDSTYLIGMNGSVQAFPNPYLFMAGLGVDESGLWSASYYEPARTLLQIDDRGRVLSAMPFSGRQSRDMAYHRGWLYVADLQTQEIRVINPVSGRLISAFEPPSTNPSGLTSDGDYVWLIDSGDKNGMDRLYKLYVRQQGGIRLASLSHNYGSVAVSGQKTWETWIYNDGVRTANLLDLVAEDSTIEIFIPHTWELPDTIAAGDSVRFRVTFRPAYSDSVHISFSLTYDIDRETNVINLRGKGVPRRRDIQVLDNELNFGIARQGFFIRGSNLRYLNLENNGGDSLTVEELRFSNDSYFYGLYDFPHTFTEPGLYRIPIFFRPEDNHFYRETLTIVSNDEDESEIQVALVGYAQVENYIGGRVIWETGVGSAVEDMPNARAIQDVDDITGDGLADVIIASNDCLVKGFHAASTGEGISIWSYSTNTNPWRSGSVTGRHAMSEGDDWDHDGIMDVAIGLDGGALSITTLSGVSGEPIWTFDTHSMRRGGGEVRSVEGRFDFNEDGVKDILAAAAEVSQDCATNAVFLLQGNSGELIWSTNFEASPIYLETTNDITGDHIRDLFVMCNNGNIYGIDGQRGMIIWDNYMDGDVVEMTTIADVNDDGSRDLAVVTNMHGLSMFNGSNGVELWHIACNQNFNNLSAAISLNDVNHNGTPDLIIGDRNNKLRAIDGLTAAAAWDTTISQGAPVTFLKKAVDYNHDGIIDFLVGLETGRLFMMSGTGLAGLWTYNNVDDGHAFVLVAGGRDLDGNGAMDVVAAMASGAVYCLAGSYVGDRTVDVDEGEIAAIPEALILDPAYPNPFNSTVRIPFQLAQAGDVNLKIIDLTGRQVYSEQLNSLSIGQHFASWSGISSSGIPVSSGVYLLQINTADERAVRRVNLIR